MMQATVYRWDIIKQRLVTKGDDMLNIIKRIVAGLVALLMTYTILTGMFATPNDIALYMLIVAGIVLLIVGLLTNIRRMSRISLGTISRAEFFGVIAVLIGWMFMLNNRIDSLYQILISMK